MVRGDFVMVMVEVFKVLHVLDVLKNMMLCEVLFEA